MMDGSFESLLRIAFFTGTLYYFFSGRSKVEESLLFGWLTFMVGIFLVW